MLDSKNVQIVDSVNDYQDAIKLAIEPLIEQGYCDQAYLDQIFKNTEKLGPYYVLGDNLALIHAENDHVKNSQITLNLIKNGVDFSDDHQHIQILIGLCAKDGNDHMQMMANIAKIFTDQTKVNNLLSAKDENELYECFINGGNL